MLQFNNNHVFTGYLKQFLSSFNLPACKIYTAEFEKYHTEHGIEHPKVIESNLPVVLSGDTSITRPANSITYLKDGCTQQYFWDTREWDTTKSADNNTIKKYWKSDKTIHYTGNKILGLTKTLKNPTTLYNYQTHEYLGDYLRFLRDYENIDLMSMYNCFSNRLCNNIKLNLSWPIHYEEYNQATGEKEQKEKTITLDANAYDTGYKIYMLPVKLFENYTIAIDCYQGIELFCGIYGEKLDSSTKTKNLIKKTYTKVPKSLFSQPLIYDKLDIKYWTWLDEVKPSNINGSETFTRAELAMQESELKLFIKLPATNESSIVVLSGDYRNFNDSLYTIDKTKGCNYSANSAILNFETNKTDPQSTLPEINSREFTPISKLQLLALNTCISYPFSDRLLEYLVANVILPNDPTTDNIARLQKVMEDCGYTFQAEGIWEPKMQMILYDYLMNNGKFSPAVKINKDTKQLVNDKTEKPVYQVKNERLNQNGLTNPPSKTGNLIQRGQVLRSDFYDVLGYVDKDAEKLYASWMIDKDSSTPRVVAKNTLENVDIYSNLYNN